MQNDLVRRSSQKRIFLSRIRRRLLRHIWILRIVFLLLGFFLISLITYFSMSILSKRTKIPFYTGLVSDFIFTPIDKIKSIEGRTNILVLGKRGVGNDSPDITDTIIFMSVNHNSKEITMISLPRDIWLDDLKTKINSVYYWGNQKQKGGGLVLAKAKAEEILGEPIQYGFVIDFKGFVEFIDVLGGVDVDVERSFVDEKYPILGRENDPCGGDPEYKCRYETIKFERGLQHMDGETALKFVRSRNAEGDEGTDFARAKRQQKVILAIKEKILSGKVIFSAEKISSLTKVLAQNSEFDIPLNALLIIGRRFLQAKDNIKTQVLPQEFLTLPSSTLNYNNLYVLVPRQEGWTEIQGWVECVLKKKACN